MPTLSSKFKNGLDNLVVEVSKVTRLKRGKTNPSNPRLSLLYFFGQDEFNEEKLVRTWFYSSEENREKEVKTIMDKYPNLAID